MKPNIFVFLLDTIRRDHIRERHTPDTPMNFIERQLQEGTFLSQYITAGNSTRISLNAVFTGFCGAVSGFNYHYNCNALFANHQAITLPELIQADGYRTLAVSQGDIYTPTSGFDEFWTFQEQFDCAAIRSFHEAERSPYFTYLHFNNLHDLAFGQPEKMTATAYRSAFDELAHEVETVWRALVKPDDIVLMLSDHGCRLRSAYDPDWRYYHEEEPTGGIFLSEETINGVCAFLGDKYFPQKEIQQLTRSIDLLPTLADSIGLQTPPLQGQSLWSVIQNHTSSSSLPSATAYFETGGQSLNGQAISRGIRTDSIKYIRYETHGERLYNLIEDPQETNNLIDSAPELSEQARHLFERQELENLNPLDSYYQKKPTLIQQIHNQRQHYRCKIKPGPRASCFAGMLTEEAKNFLRSNKDKMLPRWRQQGLRVAIFSASEHAAAFLSGDGDYQDTIIAVADNNPELEGSTFCDLPVVHADNLESEIQPDLIVVAHYFFATDMYAKIKQRFQKPVSVINAYRPTQVIPMWW